ncbi:Retrovirus-related Pol polyprotein from transposon TNT 1-94 [Apostasia shenzhenica]|uniref:Retrovirus-related Pol polyprotein from transposon TNT 1-94 n=1 Tax=Apostasia shenzhenica TaxID=1088818 RepID=A0A2I0A8T0_9ASPA|nr:Retrovirus-related Pol polyprotein from transposon TNT 1-94 [Apostasia shenzhenica]
MDCQALGMISLTLARNVAFNIVNEKTTSGLMKALCNMYEKPSALNKIYLMHHLFNLKMTEGSSITDHINEFNIITTQLSSVDINFDDEVNALILLFSLPESWSTTVTAVSSSSGQKKMKLQEIRELILSEDIRKRESGESLGTVLHTDGGRSRSFQKNQTSRSKSKRRNKLRPPNDKVCWNCGRKGHLKRNCKISKKESWSQDEEKSMNATIKENLNALVLSVDSPIES